MSIESNNQLVLFEEQFPDVSFSELYRLTWLQITKDFSHFCQVPELPEVPSPQHMLEAIAAMLGVLAGDALKLNSLFYRVDLSEKRSIPGEDAQALALMILRREAQKVWIRRQYSANQP